MIKKLFASVALAVVGMLLIAPPADAARRCVIVKHKAVKYAEYRYFRKTPDLYEIAQTYVKHQRETDTGTVYMTETGETPDISKADWFVQKKFTGWTAFDYKKVVERAFQEGSIDYLLPDGDFSYTLTDANWVRLSSPAGFYDAPWQRIDKRIVKKPAWKEKVCKR